MSEQHGLIARSDHETKILVSDLTRYRPRRIQRYAIVNTLLLTWKDSDLDLLDEINRVESTFHKSFGYRIWRYQIPSHDSQTQLALRVLQFIERFGGTDENLMVVYYSGHGGPSKSTECIWSAKREGEPTLDWSIIQPLFVGAQCDVVFFLDCCFAGQAVRSRSAHNIEFLAATDKDQFTPTGEVPGRPSFTKVLCDQLVYILDKDGVVTIPGLQSRMIRADLGLVKQPFYIALSENRSAGRIRLTRWEDITLKPGVMDSFMSLAPAGDAAALFLRLSLFAPLDPRGRQILSTWMTRDSPSSIQDIEIVEKTISQAEVAEDMMHVIVAPEESALSNRLLQPLSAQARQEGLRLFKALEDAMCMSEVNQFATFNTKEIISDINLRSNQLITFLTDSFASLESSDIARLKTRDLNGNKDLASRISMRLSLLKDNIVQDHSRVQFSDSSTSEQLLRIGKQANVPVLVEYHHYESDSEKDFDKIAKQVARICALLSEPKSIPFRILLGRGYLHETLHGQRFGLIYELPNDREAQSVTRLSNLINKVRVLPLECRYHLASRLCEAVLHLHSIGWFHKSLKAHNIVFLQKTNGHVDSNNCLETYDMENPYLIGFDCSRPSEAETWTSDDFNAENNIYRHPDRWGRPVRFERHHDIFALGTMLLEIGLWRPIASLDSKKKGFSWINPQKLVDFYIDIACPRLAHAAGTTFANAVKVCLQRTDWTEYENWEFQRIVRNQVWQPLCKDL